MAAVRSCLPVAGVTACLPFVLAAHRARPYDSQYTLSNKTGLHSKGYIIAAYVQTQRYPQLDRSHTLRTWACVHTRFNRLNKTCLICSRGIWRWYCAHSGSSPAVRAGLHMLYSPALVRTVAQHLQKELVNFCNGHNLDFVHAQPGMHCLAAPDQMLLSCFRLALQVARTDTCMTSSMAAQMGAQLSKQMPACPPTAPTQRERLSYSACSQLDRACQRISRTKIGLRRIKPGGGGSHPCATLWWQSLLPILRMGAGDLSNVLHASGQL